MHRYAMGDPFRASWRERLIVLGTLAVLLVGTLVLGFFHARAAALELVGLIPASILAVGKFLPLWGIGGQSHFSPWDLGLVVWIMDTCTVVVLVYSLEALYKVRPIEAALARVQHHASLVLTAYPRMRRAAVMGVVLFVLFPVAGTGALGGAFLGILLGLNRFVLMAAVSAGGFLGGVLMAFAAVHFGEAMQSLRAMQSDPLIKWTLIAAVVLAIAGLFWWLNRAYKRAITAARAQSAPHDSTP